MNMKCIAELLSFRDRLLAADNYFAIEPARRVRCVEFLFALSRIDTEDPDAGEEVDALAALYGAAVQEARALSESGELAATLLQGLRIQAAEDPLTVCANAPRIAPASPAPPAPELQTVQPSVKQFAAQPSEQRPEQSQLAPEPEAPIDVPPLPLMLSAAQVRPAPAPFLEQLEPSPHRPAALPVQDRCPTQVQATSRVADPPLQVAAATLHPAESASEPKTEAVGAGESLSGSVVQPQKTEGTARRRRPVRNSSWDDDSDSAKEAWELVAALAD
jgi:hypothetical protein